jgi:hypothetical protein
LNEKKLSSYNDIFFTLKKWRLFHSLEHDPDPDPDPTERPESDRLWIRNTGGSALCSNLQVGVLYAYFFSSVNFNALLLYSFS